MYVKILEGYDTKLFANDNIFICHDRCEVGIKRE